MSRVGEASMNLIVVAVAVARVAWRSMAFAAIGLPTSARALISSLLEFAKREEHDQVAMRKSVANVLPADSPRERAAKLARHRTKGHLRCHGASPALSRPS